MEKESQKKMAPIQMPEALLERINRKAKSMGLSRAAWVKILLAEAVGYKFRKE